MHDHDCVVIHPCKRLAGTIRMPGDKSISHRVVMLSALASGTSTIRGFLRSEDCLNTTQAVKSMGATVAIDGEEIRIAGHDWHAPSGVLDVGNSGTSIRLLSGLVAGRPWTTEFTGDDSLKSRPMRRIQEPLHRLGAIVELLGPNGRPPVRITGRPLKGIDYDMPVASAQVKSCVLLAGLFAEGLTRVREPMPSRDHTERLFQIVGIPLEMDDGWIGIRGYGPSGPTLAPRDWRVPGDFSSAAFWLVAGSIVGEAAITLESVGLNPRRTALLDVLQRMGASVRMTPEGDASQHEPAGTITVQRGALRGTAIGGAEIPGMIDELPVVAVAAALAEGDTVIRDAQELRVKESDRIAVMATHLRTFGVPVEERPDGMKVTGGCPIRGGCRVDSFGDHRIAMSMAILALAADAPVTIGHVACVDTSYPEFWTHLRQLGAYVE